MSRLGARRNPACLIGVCDRRRVIYFNRATNAAIRLLNSCGLSIIRKCAVPGEAVVLGGGEDALDVLFRYH